MKWFNLILLSFILVTGIQQLPAQQLVWDPVIMSTLILQHSEQQEKLKDIKSEESRILAAQVFITGKMEEIREINEKLHDRLATVSALIRDSEEVFYAVRITKDIAAYQGQMLDYASDDPGLLLVAYQAEKALIDRTAALMRYLYSSLIGGEVNLLDNRQRAAIMEHVIAELRIMRGMAFGVARRMRYAARVGTLKFLNPFEVSFPNQDKALIKELLDDF